MTEAILRQEIVKWGKSLFDRGLTAGSSGNISVRLDDGYLTTPTNSCLGFLDPERLSKLDLEQRHVSGDAPTKETPLHFAFYEKRPECRAVVHLHSTFATAVSCLSDVDQSNAIPPITPYVIMRVGRVPVVPYVRPGSADIKPLIEVIAGDHAAALLQNHGPIVAGKSLEAAVFGIEELEEAAKLVILTRGMAVRHLDQTVIDDLDRHFKLK